MGDGTATTQVLTDRLVPSELVGTAVVLHALPNNSGNIPTGDGPGQYTPNSERSGMVTETTGNTGNRIACGVIEAGGGAAGSPVR
jgi:Cu-Zn family superoxide dismutase